MIIQNTSKAVKVLKAVSVPPLRVFPGFNTVKGSVDGYFKGNRAAEALVNEGILIIQDQDKITPEQKKQADDAMKKNEALNKAKRIIEANTAKMNKQDDDIAELKKKNKSLEAMVEKLQKKNQK